MRAAASRRAEARDQSRIAALTARLRAPRGTFSMTRHASSSIMMLTRRGMVTSTRSESGMRKALHTTSAHQASSVSGLIGAGLRGARPPPAPAKGSMIAT